MTGRIKQLLIPLLFLFAGMIKSYAQQTDYYTYYNSFMVSYGYFTPDQKTFRNPLRTLNGSITQPIQTIHISLEHPRGYGQVNHYYEGGLAYSFSKKMVNDTLSANWSTLNYSEVYKIDILPKLKFIDLNIGIGPSVGFQLVSVKAPHLNLYRNVNACLLPQLELKIQPIERISFGASANYYYDLTNTDWKSFNKKYFIDYSKYTGLLLRVYLAWNFK